ncbi:MAG: DNA-directed RNA polymerase subunit L [Nanoarchaeota archaeon]
MEITVLESSKKRLVFELKGTDHTFCNALKKELLNDKTVTIATYSIRHPLIAIPKFIIETTGKDPKKVLADAAQRLKEQNSEFLQKFKRMIAK